MLQEIASKDTAKGNLFVISIASSQTIENRADNHNFGRKIALTDTHKQIVRSELDFYFVPRQQSKQTALKKGRPVRNNMLYSDGVKVLLRHSIQGGEEGVAVLKIFGDGQGLRGEAAIGKVKGIGQVTNNGGRVPTGKNQS